jgi:hypothetical protein
MYSKIPAKDLPKLEELSDYMNFFSRNREGIRQVGLEIQIVGVML